jgi:hypothetical protein
MHQQLAPYPQNDAVVLHLQNRDRRLSPRLAKLQSVPSARQYGLFDRVVVPDERARRPFKGRWVDGEVGYGMTGRV